MKAKSEKNKNGSLLKRAHLSSWPEPPSLHTAAGASGLPPQAWQADCCSTQNISVTAIGWVFVTLWELTSGGTVKEGGALKASLMQQE